MDLRSRQQETLAPCALCGVLCRAGRYKQMAGVRLGEYDADGVATCDPCYNGKPRPASPQEAALAAARRGSDWTPQSQRRGIA